MILECVRYCFINLVCSLFTGVICGENHCFYKVFSVRFAKSLVKN